MNRFMSSGILLLISTLVACSSPPTVDISSQVALTDPLTSSPNSQILSNPESFLTTRQSTKESDAVRQFSDAPDRDLYRLTNELVKGSWDLPRIISHDAEPFSVGDSETFWLVDLSTTRYYQSDFTLVLITPHAYWYVENDLNINLAELERSAADFERTIYPVITQVFGSAASPGKDGNYKLNILNAKLSGVGGYFSASDKYPMEIRPKSNQRDIIYINARNVPPGTFNYSEVLSHELQHAIHWKADASEDTWVNEGLSELASSVALDSTQSIRRFLQGEPISLINWSTSSVGNSANYGAASLFMHFLIEHYGSKDNIQRLLSIPEDSIAGINAYLDQLGYKERFNDVFKQWAAANILDNKLTVSDSILGYEELKVSAAVSGSLKYLEEKQFEIPQYSVKYIALESISEPFTLTFRGETHTALLPVDIGPSGCWWSNSGDSIDSTLVRQIDIQANAPAILEYQVWFDIENGWDYTYVEVSTDNRKIWQIIDTPYTSSDKPIGNGFGPGYTGKSAKWLTDSVDLTKFLNKKLWIRFQYITDEAVNSVGSCFRALSLASAGITPGDNGWEADGFIFTDNVVPQNFQVQLVTIGENPKVGQMLLDLNNTGRLTVLPPKKGERLIVAVGSLAEKTRESANYSLRLDPVN